MIASWTYPKKDRVKMEGYRLKTLVYIYIYVLALVGLVHRTSKFGVFFLPSYTCMHGSYNALENLPSAFVVT